MDFAYRARSSGRSFAIASGILVTVYASLQSILGRTCYGPCKQCSSWHIQTTIAWAGAMSLGDAIGIIWNQCVFHVADTTRSMANQVVEVTLADTFKGRFQLFINHKEQGHKFQVKFRQEPMEPPRKFRTKDQAMEFIQSEAYPKSPPKISESQCTFPNSATKSLARTYVAPNLAK